VGATLRGPDTVDEGHAELLVHRTIGYNNVPAIIRRLGYHRLAPERLGILGQAAALDQLAIERNLDVLAQRHRQIPDTTLNQTTHTLRNLRHTEPRKVRLPPDTHTQHIRLLLLRRDLRLADLGHVVGERLLIEKLPCLVMDNDLHLLREDIDQLHAVAILTADELLLVLVVVGRRQQLTEDHLGNPDLVLGMLGDIDGLTVILDGEAVGIT